MEHPKRLRPENLKSIAMATVVTGYPPPPQHLISSRSSWGRHLLKIWRKAVQGFRLWKPTSFMPAPAARTVQGMTITPAFMGWGQTLRL